MSDFNHEPSGLVTEQNKRPSILKRITVSMLEYLEILVFSLAVVLLLFTFVFRICKVSGDSMNNTLKDNESLIVTNLFYEPKPGDIVVFHQTGYLNEPVVKRVIAVAGETVDIDFSTMKITVTDNEGVVRVLDEPYAFYDSAAKNRYNSHSTDFSFPRTIPEGSIFVIGDNRYNSLDSRFKEVDFVDVRRVLGKVVFRIAPISEFGIIK